MDNTTLFLQYIIIGMMMPIFILPLTLLCFMKSLKEDSLSGLGIGTGISAALALCSSIIVYNLSQTLLFILDYLFYIKFISCIIIIIIAFKALRPEAESQPKSLNIFSKLSSLGINALTAFLLTLTNPVTFMIFMLLLMTKFLSREESPHLSLIMTTGLFIGTLIAYFFISYITGIIRKKGNPKATRFLLRLSAVVIIITSLAALILNYNFSF